MPFFLASSHAADAGQISVAIALVICYATYGVLYVLDTLHPMVRVRFRTQELIRISIRR